MALTAKEEEFYNNFMELLKRKGIDAEHPHRLSEVLIFNNFIDERGNLAENIPSLAFVEPGEDSPFLNEPGKTLWFEAVAQINVDPNFLDKRIKWDDEKKQEVKQEVGRVNQWCKENMKNPFDPANKPSEEHIKKLYKAYTEGRLCLDNLSHLEGNPMQNNVAWIAEGEDGTMKLTLPFSDLENRLKEEKKFRVPLEMIEKATALEQSIRENKAMRNYVIEKFGAQMISDIRLVSEPAPEMPSVLTDILAFFRIPSAREKVNAYRRYETAKNNVKHAKSEMAKEIYPGIKHPEKLVRSMAMTDFTCAKSADALRVRKHMNIIHNAKTNEEVAKKLDMIAKDRSEEEKEAMKFALESRYNGKLSLKDKKFLKDIPDIFDEVVNKQGIDVFKIESMKDVLEQHEGNLELQKKLLKLDEFKAFYEEYKAGNVNVYKNDDDEAQAIAAKENPRPAKTAANVGKGKVKRAKGDNKIYINPAKTEFTKKELNQMRHYCEKKFKKHPSVDAFTKWRAFDIAYTKMVKDPSLRNIGRNEIDGKIAKMVAKLNKMPEFKAKLERGDFANCVLAGMEYKDERLAIKELAEARAEEARNAAKIAKTDMNK